MDIKDKLTILMVLTETKNNQLANAIMVDPSLISRFRNGKRKIPNNSEYIKSIAEYFATRFTTISQRDAIERAIGKKHIDFLDKDETKHIIESWLTDGELTSQTYEGFCVKSFNNTTLSVSDKFAEEVLPLKTIMNDNKQTVYTFYGNEGKQLANHLLCEMILSTEVASEIKILTGNNTEWLWKDRKYSEQVSYNIKKAVVQGCTITRIVPRNLNVTMSFDTVSRWLPLYMTGSVNSYYYPYLRDIIFNRTLYVAPGIAALVSTTVGNKTESGLTVLTTNPDMIKSLESEFNDCLELCLPATSFYDYQKSEIKLRQCVLSFYEYQSDCISILSGLSYITTPKEVFMNFVQCFEKYNTVTLVKDFESKFSELERLLKRYRYTEIFPLDSFEYIISGKAKCSSINGEPFFYKPTDYSKHLKNIVAMLETYVNYHVVLVENELFESSIYIKNGYAVIAFLNKLPYSACECKTLDMVGAVWEYANNETKTGVPDDVYKEQVIKRINQLILQIEDYNL